MLIFSGSFILVGVFGGSGGFRLIGGLLLIIPGLVVGLVAGLGAWWYHG
jgi:hypothetical protein